MLNEFLIDLDNPPAGIRLSDGEFAVDNLVHGDNITAAYDYAYGRGVTLTVNGVDLTLRQHFNPAFRDTFVTQGLPMEWICTPSPAIVDELRAGYEALEANGG